MRPQPRRNPSRSPCLGTCAVSLDGTSCASCLRTLAEVAAWSSMTGGERLAVLRSLPARRTQAGPKAERPSSPDFVHGSSSDMPNLEAIPSTASATGSSAASARAASSSSISAQLYSRLP